MVKVKLIEESGISLADAKQELGKIKARDSTLNFRAAKCEEYFNEMVSISAEDAAKLHTKLQELDIGRLKNEHMIKITDLLPKTPDDIKLVLSGSAFSKKDLEQIAAVVQGFAK